MLPTAPDVNIGNDIEIEQRVNKTYKINGTRISGYVDGVNAIRQAVFKILKTERYQHIIYSFNYGSEYEQLIGQSRELLKNEFQRITREALLEDTRILSVTEFEFTFTNENVLVKFLVKSVEGNFVQEIQI